MADSAELVCFECELVLPLGDFDRTDDPSVIVTGNGPGAGDPVATAALWRFLAEHVYHRVELLGEASLAWERIGIDFVRIDGDIVGDPTLREYAEGAWAGAPLALRPRPVARAVGALVLRGQDRRDEGSWTAAPGDRGVLAPLLPLLDFGTPADVLVDDAAVQARLALARAAVAGMEGAVRRGPGADLLDFLESCLRVLVPALAAIGPDDLRVTPGSLAPAALFDVERALRLIQDFHGRDAGQ